MMSQYVVSDLPRSAIGGAPGPSKIGKVLSKTPIGKFVKKIKTSRKGLTALGQPEPEPIAPPNPGDPEITAAARSVRRRRRGGRSSTILGGSVGGTLERRTLLGE